MVENLTDQQIEDRINTIEKMISQAHYEDLPVLNKLFQDLIEEQVRRDLSKTGYTKEG